MRWLLVPLILSTSLLLAGCESIHKLLEVSVPPGAYKADLVIYANGKVLRYTCLVDPTSKALIDCQTQE